eukprot:scaffold9926_cov117-Isochrysis_galbana.AAC.7
MDRQQHDLPRRARARVVFQDQDARWRFFLPFVGTRTTTSICAAYPHKDTTLSMTERMAKRLDVAQMGHIGQNIRILAQDEH